MSLLGSKQTADSPAAEHQTNKNRRLAEHLKIIEILSKGGSKYPKVKVYKRPRNECLRTKMFEKLRYLTLLSELFYLTFSITRNFCPS